MSTNFSQLVRQARTHRRFIESDPIPRSVLVDLVDLARLVPSGGNQQPLRYRIVHGPDDCAKVFPHLRWAAALKTWPGPAAGERPTGYVVVLAAAGTNPATDVGIAAQTMQLAACDRGYSACMIGSIDRPAVQQALGIPIEWGIVLVLALGRPGETVMLEDLPPGGATAYWRSADGVHHVPKRALRDVLID